MTKCLLAQCRLSMHTHVQWQNSRHVWMWTKILSGWEQCFCKIGDLHRNYSLWAPLILQTWIYCATQFPVLQQGIEIYARVWWEAWQFEPLLQSYPTQITISTTGFAVFSRNPRRRRHLICIVQHNKKTRVCIALLPTSSRHYRRPCWCG